MRHIFGLIIKYYVFLMFLALQIVSLALLFRSNNFHKAEFVKHSSDVVGKIYQARAKASEYLRLGEINDELALEIAQMRTQMPENYIPLRQDVDTIRDTLSMQRYYYRNGKVVNASINREKNYIIIDRGYSGGVAPEMGVIAQGSIVGIVRSVSEHFAVVMPILHADFTGSVKLKRAGTLGSLVWGGGDPSVADVIKIPKNVPVEIGDTLVTTGFSSYFPSNILAGIVVAVDDVDNEYHIIKIKLGVDFRKLDHVFIVSDILKEEQENLIEQVEQVDAAISPK